MLRLNVVYSDWQVSVDISDNVLYAFTNNDLTLKSIVRYIQYFDKIIFDKIGEFRHFDEKELQISHLFTSPSFQDFQDQDSKSWSDSGLIKHDLIT